MHYKRAKNMARLRFITAHAYRSVRYGRAEGQPGAGAGAEDCFSTHSFVLSVSDCSLSTTATYQPVNGERVEEHDLLDERVVQAVTKGVRAVALRDSTVILFIQHR